MDNQKMTVCVCVCHCVCVCVTVCSRFRHARPPSRFRCTTSSSRCCTHPYVVLSVFSFLHCWSPLCAEAPLFHRATAVATPSSAFPSLRRPPHSDYRVLMVKRSSRSKFMPSAHVFPGGVVDAEDRSAYFVEEGREGEEEWVRACRVAAVRETFEETGVALLEPPATSEIAVSELEKWRRYVSFACEQENCMCVLGMFIVSLEGVCVCVCVCVCHCVCGWLSRSRVQKQPKAFRELCQSFHCQPRWSALVPYARWITPTAEPRRFDAVFFVATIPTVPHFSEDNQETVKVEWIAPEEALRSNHNGTGSAPPLPFSSLHSFPLLSPLSSSLIDR